MYQTKCDHKKMKPGVAIGQNEQFVMRNLHIKVLVPPVITGNGAIITGCKFDYRPCYYELII